MRRAVGIGRTSVRSWSGEGIGSVFVGTAAPGTVTQQRRHQASTGGEPIRSRAQFALLTRAWATGRPVSRPDDDDSQLQAEPVKEPLGGGKWGGGTRRTRRPGISKRNQVEKEQTLPAKQAMPRRRQSEKSQRGKTTPTRGEASGRLQGNNSEGGWVCAQRKAGIGWAISYLEPEPLVCPCEGLLFEVDVDVGV